MDGTVKLLVMLLVLIALSNGPLFSSTVLPEARIASINALVSTPTGLSFDHIIIIAMENQNYAAVMGNGSGSSNAPFLRNLLANSSTIPNYHSFGTTFRINGCSTGCYEAFTTGQQSHSDGWCPQTQSPCVTTPNIADQLHNAGLSSAMFCEDGCPRGADHFPWIGYQSTWNSCVTGSFTCTGQTGPDGNYLYGSSSSNGNTAFINYLNSANPASYIWFTPTDGHNMHNNNVTSGDSYLKQLLIGTGTISNPSLGSVLSTNLFTDTNSRTLLYLWWDENDPSPNLEYGSMIKPGFVSTATNYDEYASLHTIENNWGLTTLNHDSQAPLMSDLLTDPSPPSFAITSSPTSLSIMQTFTESVTLTTQSLFGFAGTINLSSFSNSSAVVASLASSTASLTSGSNWNTTLTIGTSGMTPIGDYAITVVGTVGSFSRSLSIMLDVNILGDITGNGIVSIVDVSIVLSHYYTFSTDPNWYPLADLNHDGVVNIQDVSLVYAHYGRGYAS